jgi:hypothetical protein
MQELPLLFKQTCMISWLPVCRRPFDCLCKAFCGAAFGLPMSLSLQFISLLCKPPWWLRPNLLGHLQYCFWVWGLKHNVSMLALLGTSHGRCACGATLKGVL